MSTNYSTTLTPNAPVQIVPAVRSLANPEPRYYVSITNVATPIGTTGGGGTAWISTLTSTPAPNQAGSIPIAPGQTLSWSSQASNNAQSFVPVSGIYGICDINTVPLTVEVAAE